MYHALLPPKTVKSLKTEYHVRFFVVLLFFISFAVLVATVFLFPSYMLSSLAEKSATANAQSAAGGIATDTAAVTAGLSSAGSLVSAMSSSVSPSLSPIVLRMAALRPRGISITSFDISYDGSALSTLTIDGMADTRSDLVTFKNIIEGNQVFSGVEVPISDLAPASHIQFSMSVSASLPSSP
jgi:zona occludens toxin (predicted ATPase)